MLIRVISDIHLEFIPPKNVKHDEILPIDDRDGESILILAGDIVTTHQIGKYSQFFVDLNSRFHKIIYVFGNHEYYHSIYQDCRKQVEDVFETYDLGNFVILENEKATFGDVDIFGAVLWTDMDANNTVCISEATYSMPEYRGHVRFIDGRVTRPFTPQDSRRLHAETILHMNEFFQDTKSKHQIIVTHHAPSHKSTVERFKDSKLNGAFVSDMENIITTNKPKLFIHGHVHDKIDYTIGDTRIIANPRAYPNEIVEFPHSPVLFIDIEDL